MTRVVLTMTTQSHRIGATSAQTDNARGAAVVHIITGRERDIITVVITAVGELVKSKKSIEHTQTAAPSPGRRAHARAARTRYTVRVTNGGGGGSVIISAGRQTSISYNTLSRRRRPRRERIRFFAAAAAAAARNVIIIILCKTACARARATAGTRLDSPLHRHTRARTNTHGMTISYPRVYNIIADNPPRRVL